MHQTHLEKSTLGLSLRRGLALAALPLLLGLWCCLSVLQQRASDIPPVPTLVGTVGVVLLGILLVQAFLLVLFRSLATSTAVAVLLVSFVGLHGPISAIFSSGYRPVNKPLLFWVWLAVHAVGLLFLFVAADKKMLEKIGTAASTAFVLLIGIQLFNVAVPIAQDASAINRLDQLIEKESPINPEQALVVATPAIPDIYYLIVDAYARQDVLSEIYDFDNSSFIEALKSRGFWVGAESRSNYNFTEYSLASSLNMRHINEVGLEEFQTRMPLRHLVRNSSVTRLLKNSGYRTYAIETGKSETECDNFDHYSSFGKALNDYQDVLYHGTPLPRLLNWTGFTRSAARRHGDRVLFAFDEIPDLASSNQDPAFVFCHMLAPHPPFLFDSEGNEVELYGHYLLSDCQNFTSCYNYDLDVYREGYVQQLEHVNNRLIEMIDRIQASSRDSVIILQADHGPRLGFGFEPDGPVTCPRRAFRECMSILNAISMPQGAKQEFYPAMTPVNTFRMVFNELFGTQLPTEPDESYSVQDFEFKRVTEFALPLESRINELADNVVARPQNLPTVLSEAPSND